MKKRNGIFLSVLLIIAVIFSGVIYDNYGKVEKEVIEKAHEDYYAIGETVQKLSYSLDRRIKGTEENWQNRYVEYTKDVDEGVKENLNNEIDNYFNYLNDLLYESSQNIKYYAIDTKTNEVFANKEDLLETLNQKERDNLFRYYITLHFDEKGELTLDTYGHDSWKNAYFSELGVAYEYTNMIYNDASYELLQNLETMKNPTNIDITIAINKNIDEYDYYTYDIYKTNDIAISILLPYFIFGAILLVLLMLLYPIRNLKEVTLLNKLANIKLEILGILYGFACLGEVLLLSVSINDIEWIRNLINSEYILAALNISAWICAYLLIVILVYMVKYILDKGIFRYLRENTVICWIWDKFKIAVDKIMTIDFSEEGNKVILKIVALNFVIISVISFFFVFGFAAALIYSVILFIILRRKFDDMKNDYQKLLKATRQLSEGDFKVNVEEDMGMFNPLKEEFSNIKTGFEKAVKEEVKSQRMKTELISNVSHDLKTPLTSIITYVDLLKQENISEEERMQYVNTIDRNSQRLKNLIDDLFEVSKANSGDVKLDLVEIDVVSLVKQAQFECVDRINEMDLDFRLQTNEDKIIHMLDSSKTYRIFENLIMNICKYAMPHTRVYIDIFNEEDKITITFKNISNSELTCSEEEIVERFVQGDKSRNTNGSGLGLSIVKSFTKLQNGEFNVNIDGDLFKAIVVFNK